MPAAHPPHHNRIVFYAFALMLCATLCPNDGIAQQRLPTNRDVEAAKERFRLPSESAMQREALPRLPNVPATQQGIDVGALAEQFEQRVRGSQETTDSARGLLVFISLDMPEPSLRRLIDQASKSRAMLLLRGLRNHSFKETLALVRRLIGRTRVAWLIDPPAFRRFGISVAPTFVLAREDLIVASRPPCVNDCLDPNAYVRVAGDVTIEYALEHIAKREPAFAPLVTPYLARLRGSP
jgi:conjugal transfer pilus assembly protein TrbC